MCDSSRRPTPFVPGEHAVCGGGSGARECVRGVILRGCPVCGGVASGVHGSINTYAPYTSTTSIETRCTHNRSQHARLSPKSNRPSINFTTKVSEPTLDASRPPGRASARLPDHARMRSIRLTHVFISVNCTKCVHATRYGGRGYAHSNTRRHCRLSKCQTLDI